MRVLRYKVVLTHSEEGVSISCPALPGCWSQGADDAEALENIADAIKEYLAALEDMHQGEDIREVEVAV
ncbi:MAG: HicB family protein [Anaerolinea sp.]|nr:HicB family protein [Anaerolinea sp.]